VDVAALILAIIAVVLFATARYVHIGLALLTAAWVCQVIALTGTHVSVH
jgi:hypothetical protein